MGIIKGVEIMEVTFIGQHTKRCPKCKSDEYLSEAKETTALGEKYDIRFCSACQTTYRVWTEAKKKDLEG